MSDPNLLDYQHRRYGMDHERYEWSMLQDREPVHWPDGKPLALWVNVSVQHFPLSGDKPTVAPPGALTMPYPLSLIHIPSPRDATLSRMPSSA